MPLPRKSLIRHKYQTFFNLEDHSFIFFFPSFFSVLCAVFLRFFRVGSLSLFQDEIHSILKASNHSYLEILFSFDFLDSCIPLTLLNKILLDFFFLNEWLIRLPSLISACFFLLGAVFFLKNYFPPHEVFLLCALFGFSPFFVYLSQEARPYSIVIFLVHLSLITHWKWKKTDGNFFYLFVSLGSSLLALYFHPIVFPSLLFFWLFPIFLRKRGYILDQKMNQYQLGIFLFLFLSFFLFIPTLPSLLQQISIKSFQGGFSLKTILAGVTLILGIPWTISIFFFLLFLILGVFSLFQKNPFESLLALGMLVSQLLFLAFLDPFLIKIPWVWLKYMSCVLPIALIFSVRGFFVLISSLKWFRSSTSLFPLALFLGIVFFGFHVFQDHFPFLGYGNHLPVPRHLFLPRNFNSPGWEKHFSRFYREIKKEFPKPGIIEAPWIAFFEWEPGVVFQKFHRCPVIYGNLGGTLEIQNLTEISRKNRFKTVSSQDDFSILPKNFKYLVIHKNMDEETKSILQALSRNPSWKSEHFKMEWKIKNSEKTIPYKEFDETDSFIRTQKTEPFFEDEYLVVYKISNLLEKSAV